MQKGARMDIIFKRPAVAFCIIMLLGIYTAYQSNSLFVIMSLAFLFICCFFTINKLRDKGLFVPIGMLAFFLFGALHFLFIEHVQLKAFSAYEGNYVAVKGYIASEPEIKGEKVSYILNADSIRGGYSGDFVRTKGKILLTTLYKEDSSLLHYGNELVCEGTLYQPRGVRNPGGFDYRRYLAQKGVGATIFSYPYAIEPKDTLKGNFAVSLGIKLRKRIVYVIESSLPKQQAGLLNGMLIGYRKGLSKEVQDAFSNAGLTHIMAVSGANISFIILPLAFLLKKLKVRKRASNIALIFIILLFVLITGFEPSVLRAAVMACILLVAAILYREPDVYAAIAVSCIVLLSINPCLLFNIGFQLSYVATISIVMLYKNIKVIFTRPPIPKWVSETLAATISAQLGVLPITIVCFNKLSLISIISNLLAVPMLEFITILGMIMAIVGQFSLFLSRIIGYINSIFLGMVLYITKFSSELPYASVRTVTPSIIFVVMYYAFIWFVLWYKPTKKITLKPKHGVIAVSILAVILLFGSFHPQELQVIFLDVGQGDSAFIRTYSGKTILIDGGGSNNSKQVSNIGENVLLPFLLDSGVMKLDAVIASHSHSDHIEGLFDVLEHMKVKRLIIPHLSDESCFKELLEAAEANEVPVSRCYEDDVIKLDDKTYMEVLNPPINWPCDEDSLNNTSLVLRLCYAQTSVLFTGDAEGQVEERLVGRDRSLTSDIIKIGHHGSPSSTGEAFLKSVDPKTAIISVGSNSFGHPADTVLDLLEQSDIDCLRTDESGAIIMRSNGKRIKIKRTVAGKREDFNE